MNLQFASINSGSNGNCYYVGNDQEAVLVDVGLSCKETEKRMLRAGLEIEKVKGIFVSHEHSDHIQGVQVLSAKYSLPVFISASTLINSKLKIEENLIREINDADKIAIGKLYVHAFKKQHDAIDPFSFVIEGNGNCVGVFTDMGKACKKLIKHFGNCHAAFLESNYDDAMLADGGYPMSLQNRIRGGKGHLSNAQALELFLLHRHPGLQTLLLAHLSENNNRVDLVQELFNANAQGVRVEVMSRYNESEIFSVSGGVARIPILKKRVRKKIENQLELFV